MPVDRRKRTPRHEQSHKTGVVTQSSDAVDEGPRDQERVPNSTRLKTARLGITKKQKQSLRRDALKQRLGIAGSPYSKSHRKRLNRKGKDRLITDLKAVEQAIAAVDMNHSSTHSNSLGARQGQIGEGNPSSLTSKQRQRTLHLESLRHKLVLQTPEFVSNPFQTIRTHAQNTLIKHQ